MWVSTFHSACVRILRRDGDKLGYPAQFTIYDQSDAVRLVTLRPPRSRHRSEEAAAPRRARRHLEREEPRARGRRVRGHRSGRSSSAASPTCSASTRPACCAPARWTSTTCWCRPSRCCKQRPDVLAYYQDRFRHVLVDEYQDTNPVQNDLVVLLGSGAPQRLRRRRRRSVHLRLPRRRSLEHPGVRAGVPRRDRRRAGSELPVHADDPRRRERGDREQRFPQAEGTVVRGRGRREDRALHRRGRERGSAVGVGRDHADGRLRRLPLGRRRGLLPHERPVPRARRAVHARRCALPGHRRHPVLRPA